MNQLPPKLHPFASVPVSDEQSKRIFEVKQKAMDFLDVIYAQVKDGREKSLAITKLEECVMWATKSIAHE